MQGGKKGSRVIYRGRFLDLSVLCFALRNKHFTLEQALRSVGLKGKMRHEPTGKVTEKELKYGRKDVERSVALLNATKREYDGFALDLPPESAMSAASITKAFLEKMRVAEPARKFKLSGEVLGRCMQAYAGGRSEIRIRHQEVPVVVCDTTSEYPSVAGLLKLWPLVIAAEVEVEEYPNVVLVFQKQNDTPKSERTNEHPRFRSHFCLKTSKPEDAPKLISLGIGRGP